jgi:hypothetical protein
MAYARWKLGALGALCAVVNLRCGSSGNDLFQGSGGSASGPEGVSGSGTSLGGDGATAGGSSAQSGGTSSGGTSASAGTDGGGDANLGGTSQAGSAGAGVAGSDVQNGGAGGVSTSGGASSGGANSGGVSGGGASAAGMSGGGVAGSGASAGASGGSGAAGSAGAGSCGSPTPTFAPRAPELAFVVDRSSTMFDNNYWAPVRTSVLSVVNTLQSQIKFGLAAYTGVVGNTCPLDFVSAGTPTLNDYSTINPFYSGLASVAEKSESPTAAALAAVLAAVPPNAGPSTGAPIGYVFLITDGGQDFCNDGNNGCASDAVVYELQALKAAGVTSKVFGIKGSASLAADDLTDFENAGAGAAVAGSATAIYTACHGVSAPWTTEWSALGRAAAQALGTYQPGGGSTPSVLLDTTSTDSMTQALLSAAAQTKSCSFDVSGAGIDLANAGQGTVQIDGANVSFNANNGWTMPSATVLTLVGSACTKWRAPSSTQISFDFPCSSLN